MNHHSDLVAALVSIYRPHKYLELGLSDALTFGKVAPYCGNMTGVDIVLSQEARNISQRYPHVRLVESTTNAFFSSFDEKFDMIFIDADHCIESAYKDFENSLKTLNRGGVILMHDTDPVNDDLFSFKSCGDSYKIIKMLEQRNDVNIVTIPIAEAGLSIITLKNDTRTLRRHPEF